MMIIFSPALMLLLLTEERISVDDDSVLVEEEMVLAEDSVEKLLAVDWLRDAELSEELLTEISVLLLEMELEEALLRLT